MTRARRPALGVTVIAVLAALTVACSTTDPDLTQPTTTTVAPNQTTGTTAGTTPPATSTPGSQPRQFNPDQQRIADAYLAASEAVDQASAVANPDDPTLAATLMGEELAQWRVRIINWRLQGQIATLPPGSRSRSDVLEVEITGPATAIVKVCVVDDGVVSEVATGKVIDDEVVTGLNQAEMRIENDQWKVARETTLKSYEGVQSCHA